MLRLSRSLSRFETQDIKTQPMNQPLFSYDLKLAVVVGRKALLRWDEGWREESERRVEEGVRVDGKGEGESEGR